MTQFEVIRGFGIPQPLEGSKYPFAKLGVGDAFIVSALEVQRARTTASKFGKKTGRKIAIRKRDDNTYVVVRVA